MSAGGDAWAVDPITCFGVRACFVFMSWELPGVVSLTLHNLDGRAGRHKRRTCARRTDFRHDSQNEFDSSRFRHRFAVRRRHVCAWRMRQVIAVSGMEANPGGGISPQRAPVPADERVFRFPLFPSACAFARRAATQLMGGLG